ncbi:unnamed protein product [Closterium sp. Naga37s-1]|nr:unnamed protein product [Closterium sp. Naga37s-1]
MATSPDSSSTVVRRQRPSVTQSPAAAGTRRSPRPVLLQPSPPVSRATNDEPSSSATRPMPALPKVKIPSFPEQTRPQGPPKRNADADAPSPRHRMTKRVRHAYTAKEKLHWLKLQESQPDLSNRALAKLAKVQPCQIREWKRMKERLEVASGCRRRLMGAGRRAKYPFMERAVYRQFLKHRAKGLASPLWHLGEVEVLEDVNEMVEDEVIPNPYFEEARVPAEVLQADVDAMHVEQDEEDADAEDGDGEGYGAGEDGDADEWSEAGSDWWLPDRFDGEEVEEWNAGDEE